MNKEQKELLLQDLCSRLPYGVKLDTLEGPQKLDTRWLTINMCNISSPYLPYLFPLSSMTEAQTKELNEIINLEVEVAISHIKSGIPNLLTGIKRLNWFLKNHFDIYGLIPMGLAENATDKNIY